MQSTKKKPFVKNSSKGQSSGLLKALQKVINNQSGSVSYVFLQEKVTNIHEQDYKKIDTVKVKSILHSNLSVEAVKDKTVQELLYMFHSTKHDLGASYFIVD